MPNEGGEVVVINSQERAISSDINRMQSFRARDVAEAFRHLYSVYQGLDDSDAGALYSPSVTTGTPLGGDIFAGFLVLPQVGSLNLLVTQGLGHFVVTAPTGDVSPYYFCEDNGVAILGSLAITPNSTAGTRIDVVECQPSDAVIETDSRNVFNPVSGLFTAQNVTKATAARMTYRVRAGTNGGGFPGFSPGWMPLAVASVPTGTTTNDTITFWDVRPLLDDRAKVASIPRRSFAVISGQTVAAVSGNVDFTEPTMGRRLGGRLRRGSPGTDAQTVSLTDAANQDSSVSGIGNGQAYYLWLATPFGLPRWARYTDATSGARLPRSPRGIFIVSANGPQSDGTINPSSPPGLPASLGLGNTSITAAVCVGAGLWGGSGAPQSISVANDTATGFFTTLNGTISGNVATYSLTGVVPPNARAIYLSIAPNLTVTTPGNYVFQVTNGVTGGTFMAYVSGTASVSDTMWIEIPPVYPAGTPVTALTLSVSPNTGITLNSAAISVLGWRLQ